MKRRSYPERIRAALFLAIKRTAANLDACVKVPGKDFSRTRKLPLQAMLLMLIGMGSGSLSKELYDWFGYTSSTATASAFVQQRNKIRPEAVKMIFNEFVSSTTPTATFQGYRLFAVDGSDLRLPSDPTNDFSLIRNAEGQKQYNLAHLNAMFDLMSKVYVDATMQGKKGMNEHSALVLLQEVFARLIFYNYASLIARQVPAPQGKQINFSVAILACKQFLKGKIRSAQIFEILSMHLSPIRPGRQYKRYQNPVSAVAFQYRLS